MLMARHDDDDDDGYFQSDTSFERCMLSYFHR